MPSYPIEPDKLLEHARHLAGDGAGPGRPNYTNHRRAVSGAYYATFHQLTERVAHQLFPSSEPFRLQARRSVTHDAIHVVCKWLTGRGHAPQHLQPIVDELKRDETVWAMADSLIGLKEAREEADYDHTRLFDKREAIGFLSDARTTVEQLRVPAPSMDAVMALIALKTTPR